MKLNYVRFFMALSILLSLCSCSSKVQPNTYTRSALIESSLLATDNLSMVSSKNESKSFQSSQDNLITTYGEIVIDEPYFWNTIKAVSFNAAYPVFTDPQLTILNNAITDEVQSWYKIYDAICRFANEECSRNDKYASLGRHITTSYTVEETDDHLNVKFRVDYFMKLSNMEYWYEITFTYDIKYRMLYETITTTRRIYG